MTRKEAIAVFNSLAIEMTAILAGIPKNKSEAKQIQRYIDAFDMAISALRQQDVADKDVGKNEPLTNAQKIRAMSDEELVEFIKNIKVRAALCKAVGNNDAFEELCSAEWLQQPVEEADYVV